MDDWSDILVAIIMIPLVVIAALLIWTLWGLVWSFPLMLSWNYVMPAMFGLKKITYWQMFALYMVLTSLWKSTTGSWSRKK
ncbi:hypothetical protein MUP79_08685 [Candidatus Bathyarchaeota archaeon]|nr:hypothetical protein [Candidatus Bathyarchaeota archaeon]